MNAVAASVNGIEAAGAAGIGRSRRRVEIASTADGRKRITVRRT